MKKKITNKLCEWLKLLNSVEVIPDNIMALYFGLYEGETDYIIYLIGSELYDENNDDWACNIDYEPKLNYIPLCPVQEMSWLKVEQEVILTLEEYLQNIQPNTTSFFMRKIICVGFDDGNLIRIQ